MALIVLDTDVWSYLFKGNTPADAYRLHLTNKDACVSFQTGAELYQWADWAGWGDARRAELDLALKQFKVLLPDDLTCRIWARMRSERAKQGRPIAPQDAWISACAIRHDAELLTHNADDYALIPDLKVVQP